MQSGITTAGRMAYRFVVIAPDAGTRDRLRAWMAAADIRCIVPVEGFELLHRYLKLSAEAFANAERLAETTLSLPLYPALSDADVDRVCEALQSFRA
jgi:dTDP-4-amino-4,6-dideoxygalactose transaminase